MIRHCEPLVIKPGEAILSEEIASTVLTNGLAMTR